MGRLTWKEIVKRYPDRWVAMKDCVKDGPDVVYGVIEAVLTDEEICNYEAKNLHKGLVFRRTTEGFDSGIINADFSIIVT